MHCDEKRTITVLKSNIVESVIELIDLVRQTNSIADIQKDASDLEKFISENKRQFETS